MWNYLAMEGKRGHLFKMKWLVVDSCGGQVLPPGSCPNESDREHGWREPNKAPQAQKNQEKYSSGLQFWEFLPLNAAFWNRLYMLQRRWHVNFLISFLIYSMSWALCWSLHKAEDKWKHGSIHQEVTSVWLTSLMSATGRYDGCLPRKWPTALFTFSNVHLLNHSFVFYFVCPPPQLNSVFLCRILRMKQSFESE